jgi:4-hydroxy-2-oxoheptanedioate aldolase
VAVDGLDVIFIGPTDLSHSLGVTGQLQHPTVKAAMQEIVQTVERSKAALGILVGSAQAAQEWRDRGARYIAVTFESLLTPAVQHYLGAVRESE